MTGYYCDSIGMVEGEMSIYEDEEVCDGLREGEGVCQ